MKRLLNGFLAVTRKEWLHILRDRGTLIIALGLPMVQLLLFGYAVDFDVRHVPTLAVDFDRTTASRTYLESLNNTEYLNIIGTRDTPRDAEDALRRGDAEAAVIVPAGFGRELDSGQPATVRALIDGSDGQAVGAARNGFARPPSGPTQPVAPGQPGPVNVRLNILFNPDVRTQIYTIPGLAAVLLQLITVTLTSLSIVREREAGTLEQLLVSPVGILGLLLGKVAPYAVIAMFELTTVLFLGSLVFDVQCVGSVVLLYLMSVPFVLGSLSLGLCISTLAQNQAQASQMTIATTLPSILLSGYIAPRETLPLFLYWLSCLLPVTHFIVITRGIMVRGEGFIDLLPSFGWLMLLMTALIWVAAARFKKSLG